MKRSISFAAMVVLPIPAIPGIISVVARASRRLTILSSSFSRPKKWRSLGKSPSDVTSCFSTCFDKSRSIRSSESERASRIRLSSKYRMMSTGLIVNGRTSWAPPREVESVSPSVLMHRNWNSRNLPQVSSAARIPASVKKYAFLFRLTP